ncbi:MAG: flagellar hook protein FlgE [Limnochordia bacterium]|jgi:flagellar hook protein FlgE
MMRSLFSGLAGMRTQQQFMDVIGNNIANVNTAGYKAGRVTFEDLLYESIRAASDETNPVQVGGGARVSSIDTIFRQGHPQSTGNQHDLAISGDGFLVVQTAEGQGYTRAGVLSFNTEGYLVHTATGNRVMGWTADRNGNVQPGRALKELRAAPGTRAEAAASTGVTFEGLFDARLPLGSTVTSDITVIDPLGDSRSLVITFARDTTTDWSWTVPHPVAGQGQLASGTVTFDALGRVSAATAVSDPITLDMQDGITPPLDFTLDFTVCELSGGETKVSGQQVGGIAAGTLKEVAIDESGHLIGVFSNGVNRVLGQLALATFVNPEGLQRVSGNLFAETLSSGGADTRAPGKDRGTLNPGYLEMSNVDLTQEFASMILSQRAFQANSRLITAADELLQEVINLRR